MFQNFSTNNRNWLSIIYLQLLNVLNFSYKTIQIFFGLTKIAFLRIVISFVHHDHPTTIPIRD